MIHKEGIKLDSQKKIQIIGTKKPNPLGIYDMLGNVSEICFDPFRLNYHQGRSGGYVVRGGDLFLLNPDNIRSSFRLELPFYKGRETQKSPNTGFRVVINAPLMSTQKRIDEIRKKWKEEGEKGKLKFTLEEANQRITALYDKLTDKKLKREVAAIKSSYEKMVRQVNEVEERDALTYIRLGTYIAGTTSLLISRKKVIQSILDGKVDLQDGDARNKYQNLIEKTDSKINENLSMYGNVVENLYKKMVDSQDIVDKSYEMYQENLSIKNLENQIQISKIFIQHAKNFRQWDMELWIRDLTINR